MKLNLKKNVCLENNLKSPDNSETVYFMECDLRNIRNIEEKTRYFPFTPEKKLTPQYKYTEFMNKTTPNNYKQCKKMFFCDWTYKKNI